MCFLCQILGVLCQDGILRFVNLGTFVQLFDVGRLDDRVSNFIVSSNGRHIVAVMDSGNINVYNAQMLVRALNKVTRRHWLLAAICYR
jgi:hypothetical protein